jgi:competence protein ComEC
MSALSAAAAFIVGLQPRIISDVSFQLSFTAMAGLVLLAPPIERRLRRILSEGEEEDGGWSRALTYAVATTIAATLATLPLAAFYFQQVSLVGLPAALLALPVLAPTLGMGLVTAVLGLLNTGAAQVAGWGTWLLLSYLKEMVELFDPIPGGTLKVGRIGAPMVIVYYGALIGFILGRSRREWLSPSRHSPYGESYSR